MRHTRAVAEERDSRVPNVDTRFLNLARRPRDYQIYAGRSTSLLKELATMVLVGAIGLTAIVVLVWLIQLIKG